MQSLLNATSQNDQIDYPYYYQKLFRAAECGSTLMPKYSEAQDDIEDLHFQTVEELQTYLVMCESFQDRGLQLTPDDIILTTCEFNMSTQLRQRH